MFICNGIFSFFFFIFTTCIYCKFAVWLIENRLCKMTMPFCCLGETLMISILGACSAWNTAQKWIIICVFFDCNASGLVWVDRCAKEQITWFAGVQVTGWWKRVCVRFTSGWVCCSLGGRHEEKKSASIFALIIFALMVNLSPWKVPAVSINRSPLGFP